VPYLFTYGPGIAYSLKALSRVGLTKYFVDFTGRSAAHLLSRAGLKSGRPGRAVHGRWLHDLLDQLIETTRLRPAARKIVSNLLVIFLLERVREDLRFEAH
jgi:hypothetical protein